MHFSSILLIGLTLLSSSIAFTYSPGFEVFESLSSIPQGWVQTSSARPNQSLNLRIAVRQQRAAEFEQRVLDLSTPGHALYGQHMDREQVKDYLKPTVGASQAIRQWLASENVADINDDGDWIRLRVTVTQAEALLNTTFSYYYNEAANVTAIRTLQYSVPVELHDYIQMVQPTTRFGSMQAQMSSLMGGKKVVNQVQPAAYDPVFCNSTITPDCLRGLYGMGNFTAKANAGTTLGISGYLKYVAQFKEVENFLSEYAPYATGHNFSLVSINGGQEVQGGSDETGEANLDVQYGIALANRVPTTFYTTGGLGQIEPDLDQPDTNSNEPYLDQLHYLLSLPNAELPTVLSTSYGEDEQSVPEPYANATCSLFAQLGARGVSVIFSSGDTGVGSACQTNDGKNATRFLPTFPASCPFVTSVGGTHRMEPERAAYFSSGGFSDRFARPAYQEKAVCGYLDKLGDRWAGLYNPNGRGVPDVAAQSMNFLVFDRGQVNSYHGTSCAAPVFAAVIASLSSIRTSSGKPPLGFLNPWLYSTGYKGFNDIVDGGSTGCMGHDQYSGQDTPFVPYASWNATVGWDPVTGLGTPRFMDLLTILFEGGLLD